MIPPNNTAAWSRIMTDSTRLWIDAHTVMSMRMWRMMGGGAAANREAERMMAEKIEAGFELAGAMASGKMLTPEAAARKSLSVAGKRVRANRKRLG